MGRGSDSQKKLAQQQAANYQAILNKQLAERDSSRGNLIPIVRGMETSEGYDPAEKTAMTGNAMEATDASFDAGNEQAANHVARTNNDAGYFGALGEMTRDRARTKADTSRGLVQTFADEKQRRRMAGAQLDASMYGNDNGLLASIAGLPIGALNARSSGIGTGGNVQVGGVGFSY